MKTRILGIDPGIAIVGWAVIDLAEDSSFELVEFGTITTPKEDSKLQRIQEVWTDIQVIIEKYKPSIMGIETLLFSRNVTTAMAVSEVRGVILLSAGEAGLDVIELNPMQVKSAVTGYGKAKKQQIQESVRILCNLEEVPKPDDAADAIAVAIGSTEFIKEKANIFKIVN